MNLIKLLLLVGLVSSFDLQRIQCDETGKAASAERSDDELIADVANLTKAVQQQYLFARDSRSLVPWPDPTLRWSNPTAGKVFGNVCVWTEDGRPMLVACIYRFFSPNWGATLELCSLADNKLVGSIDNQEFWKPDSAGLKRERLQADEKPANSAAARLVQMRRLAAEFSAHLEDTRGTDKQVARELRLLPKPIFRYPADASGLKANYVDGALFAFVEGTDPEVLLVVEAVGSAESLRWEYGLARMNRDALRVKFRGQPVWSVPYLEKQLNQPSEPYSLFPLDRPSLGER